MKQVIQSYRTGEINLADVPIPAPKSGDVIVRTMASLVSVGTEKYMLELAWKSLVGKALAGSGANGQVLSGRNHFHHLHSPLQLGST